MYYTVGTCSKFKLCLWPIQDEKREDLIILLQLSYVLKCQINRSIFYAQTNPGINNGTIIIITVHF